MTTNIHQLNTLEVITSPVDLELLETLLEPEDETYPWNIYDQSSEAYFDSLEQHFDWQDLSGMGLQSKSESFYENLDSLWCKFSSNENHHINSENTVHHLQEILKTTLTISVPTELINAIAKKAAEVFLLQKSTSEKLVECVQNLLPNLATDDLLVLARPFAYSMRSQESSVLTSMINNFENENRDWVSLSEIEQARLSLALTNYALQHLQSLEMI